MTYPTNEQPTNDIDALPSCIGCFAHDLHASAHDCHNLIDRGVCRVAIWREVRRLGYVLMVDVTAERVKGGE